MSPETRVCQSCKNQFTIEPDDFSFYEKIKVPPPTWCPGCRQARRFMFRNERALYKRECALCKKSIIAMYAPDTPYVVACLECWWSDAWDPMDFSRDYDFSRPFFEQFRDLMRAVPRPAFLQRNAQNCFYSNSAAESKDAYLSYSVVESEKIYYSKNTDRSKEIFDSLYAVNAERCYQNIFGYRNYNCVECWFSEGCIDSWFLYDCDNCQDCALSVNLRKRQYVIRNVQYTKEAYFEKLKELGLDTRSGYDRARDELVAMKTGRAVHKYANTIRTLNSTGDNIANAKGSSDIFDSHDVENSKHAVRLFWSKDSRDADYTFNAELVYEYINGGKQLYDVKFSTYALENMRECDYTDNCGSSGNLFGCIGLRGKEYCILNRQYAKDEYQRLVGRIKEHMSEMPYRDTLGREYRYGEFFPPEMSPFCYNETIAQEHFPLTSVEASRLGVSWREEGERSQSGTLNPDDLGNRIEDAPEGIERAVVSCAHRGECNHQCTRAFRFIEQELSLYRTKRLPLPRLCPNCRHYARLAQRNPLQLWKRVCACSAGRYRNTAPHQHGDAECAAEFETAFAPDRPEIVYCENCYAAEVM